MRLELTNLVGHAWKRFRLKQQLYCVSSILRPSSSSPCLTLAEAPNILRHPHPVPARPSPRSAPRSPFYSLALPPYLTNPRPLPSSATLHLPLPPRRLSLRGFGSYDLADMPAVRPGFGLALMDPCPSRARPLGCVTTDRLMPKGECRGVGPGGGGA